MSLKLGNTDINKGYLGGTEIKKAYLGNTIVFDNTSDTRFITTHNIASNGETLTLPYSGNNETDWGDGTITATGNSHTYTNSGVYTVKIDGVVDDWAYNNSGDRSKLINIENFGGLVIIDYAFYGCSNMDITATDIPQISSSLNGIFRSCSDLVFNPSVNDWDVSNVTTLGTAFFITPLFNQPLDKWNVSNVESLSSTFRSSGFNQNINSWNTSKCTSFNSTFRDNDFFNQDISSWNYSLAMLIAGFMQGKSSFDFDYQNYDSLLITWDNQLNIPVMSNKTVNMGTIQYSSAGAAAHASLTTKGLIITDGGQNAF